MRYISAINNAFTAKNYRIKEKELVTLASFSNKFNAVLSKLSNLIYNLKNKLEWCP